MTKKVYNILQYHYMRNTRTTRAANNSAHIIDKLDATTIYNIIYTIIAFPKIYALLPIAFTF